MDGLLKQLTDESKRHFSFELLPPPKGKDVEIIYNAIDPLVRYKPSFISVTYHREEIAYKMRKDGFIEKKTIHKRPGTVAISAAIKHRYNIRVIPHMICGGFSKEETENALIDLHFLGIRNILGLRGDPSRFENKFEADPNGHNYASDLVNQIMNLNNGQYLDDELLNSTATDFIIGVAGYPEKHFEAPNSEYDLINLKRKVDAGAKFIITQMFFDNKKFFNFVDKCRNCGINVPIIPGIKPITAVSQLASIPSTFFVNIPQALVEKVSKFSKKDDVIKAGVEWSIKQAEELYKFGCNNIHYFTMGRSSIIKSILDSTL
ncbi:MAG: methylenetetrahydrofolate reductase [NAD(P)H] [Bacteroidales bacterium]|nr:methylenetetrahydrofolate reductase [NAD(P)H] [Bacteroidales bacterium]